MYRLVIIIASLNGLDGVLTFWGIKNGNIIEANPIMDWVWKHNPIIFLGIKISLSLILLIIGYFLTKQKQIGQRFIFVLKSTTVLYLLVSILHMKWIVNLS
jgi:uncharacterized membrane protein